MKIKVSIIVLILAAFMLTINQYCYADISIDDMGFLLEDEADSAQDNDVSKDIKAIEDNVATVNGKITDNKLTVKFYLDKAADILHRNIVIVAVVGGCCLFFIIILYIFYVKIKKLSEQAQVSKDLAEKYFYNIQEHRKERVKIEEVANAKASKIDSEISGIITSVEQAFDEETKETTIPDDKPGKIDDTGNGIDNGALVTGSEETPAVDSKENIVDQLVDQKKLDDVDKAEKLPEIGVPETNTIDNIDNLDILKTTEDQDETNDISEAAVSSDGNSDGKEEIVDQKEQDNEVKDEEKVPEKPPETAVPETNSVDDIIDIPEITEDQEQIKDINKTEDSTSPNTTDAVDKDNKGDEPDDNKAGEPEALLNEKDGNMGTSSNDDIGIDIDDILKMETEDEGKDGKK
ncbi:MAG: hypothetical protein ACUZ8E_09275 [Candidatus Anammoxibacter sp.]